jgi:hypothetical protein
MDSAGVESTCTVRSNAVGSGPGALTPEELDLLEVIASADFPVPLDVDADVDVGSTDGLLPASAVSSFTVADTEAAPMPAAPPTAIPVAWGPPGIALLAHQLPPPLPPWNSLPPLVLRRTNSVDSSLDAALRLPAPVAIGTWAADWPVIGSRGSRGHPLPPLLPKPEEPPAELFHQLSIAAKRTGYGWSMDACRAARGTLATRPSSRAP